MYRMPLIKGGCNLYIKARMKKQVVGRGESICWNNEPSIDIALTVVQIDVNI